MTTSGGARDGEWVWRWTLEHRRVRGPGGDADIFWLTLPGWFEREQRLDPEALLGPDWDAPLMKLILPDDRWWLWWTEKAPLERLRRAAPRVRHARRVPRTWPAQGAHIGRGFFQTFGAALLPPDAALQALVIEHGPSSYSEVDPNFILALSPQALSSRALSPAELVRQVASATPSAPGLEQLAGVADRLVMQWNGDVYCGARAEDEAALLATLTAWSETRGLRVSIARERANESARS